MLVKAGFVEWLPPPTRATPNPVRLIMLTSEVDEMLKGLEPPFPRAEAKIVMANFRAGSFATVSRRESPRADLKRMVGVDEVWVLCFRKPKSGGQGRLFGRFAQKDVFVGLSAELRDNLGGSAYSDRANEAIAIWNERVGFSVFQSDHLEDYLSPVFRDMDADA